MWVLYLIVNNFGWAVILFTLVVKAVSFPLTLKQQRNMAVSQIFTPRVQEIQKKYRSNQQKMQEEMAKLQKEGYNPVGGCGPMLLTMLILFGVLDVVYKPLTHMERLDKETISNVQELAMQVDYTEVILASEEGRQLFLDYIPRGYNPEDKIKITNEQRENIGLEVKNNLAHYTGTDSPVPDLASPLKSVAGRFTGLQRELYSVKKYSDHPDAFTSLNPEALNKLDNIKENMIFFGMNLGETPHYTTFNNLWFIAMFCFICSVAQMMVQQYIQKRSMPTPQAGANTMKMMMLMGPVFSLFIVFVVPAGAGLYWSVSYLFMIAQSIIIYKFWPPHIMQEQAKERVKIKNGGADITAKIVDVDEDGNEVVKEEKLSEMSGKEQKEYFRKKLEDARKADLEKYGDTPDIDLSEYDKPDPQKIQTDETESGDVPHNDEGEE